MRSFGVVGSAVVICAFLVTADVPQTDNRLWEYRNLGKAFYENPDTHREAVEQLRRALELVPNSVRERINYGLGLLRAGQTDAGIAELLRAQKQDASIPHTWFNLGIAYKHLGQFDQAIEQLRGMIRLVPAEPIGHYNLGAVLKDAGHMQAAVAEFLEAERLNPNLSGPHFQLFTYYQRTGDKDAAARERQAFQEAKQRAAGAAVPEDMEWCFYAELYDPPEPRPSASSEPTKYEDRVVSTGWDAANSGMLVIDSEGVGHADLLVWSRDRIQLLKRGVDAARTSGLENVRGVRTIAAGDFDNDGLPDLCVVTAGGAILFHNDHGTFTKYADLPGTTDVTTAVWLDYDHDYDLDLLLFGPNPVLMRNNGNGKFENRTASFPFVKGNALDAVMFAVAGDTAARDLVVSYADRPAVLYHDKLNGVFEGVDLPAIPAGARSLDSQDFNHDSLLDLVSYSPEIRAIRNDSGRFVAVENAKVAPSPARADFNGDDREDYARVLADGSVHVYLNASPTQNWLSVRIQGVKNIKEAVGATVEMKSGAFYNKRVYHGVPLAFAIDGHSEADTIRITWPNGLIQNEVHEKGRQLAKITEAQRLSGSCPMIFAWNGHSFEFITDVLGVAPLGASSGDGNYFPVNHRENIQIPGSLLPEENGAYRIHITEELHEVSYLDQVRLIAVDHPSQMDIYTNDKFKSPPYAEFRLFGAEQKIHATHAIDDRGNDVTALIARRDHRYPTGFAHNTAGVAKLHTLDLDFGTAAPNNHAALVLNGWVDWADGSTFLGASQNGNGGLVFPYLQVKNGAGKWQTVVGDMGIPSGKPKTIVVDLAGKFLSRARQIRIVTNLCVYWDEIFLIDDSRTPKVRLTTIDADAADLHFRGFSRAVIDAKREQPERFLYDEVRPVSSWNPTSGNYTRYGDVRTLVTGVDDRMVIMGSGDELRLQFPAKQLPKLPEGWSRDFLLSVDGWAKDADANTAFSQSVGPLPFHNMSSYPYKKDEHFPSDDAHVQYVRDYLTRPALRLIQPLAALAETLEYKH